MERIKEIFAKKSCWIDILIYQHDGYYKLIQMRIVLFNNKKEFRECKILFINDCSFFKNHLSEKVGAYNSHLAISDFPNYEC